MFDNIDPKVREYGTFSFIISMVFSIVYHFTIIEAVKGGFLYGFPINLTDLSGFVGFLARIIDSIVLAAILTPGVYYVIMKYIFKS